MRIMRPAARLVLAGLGPVLVALGGPAAAQIVPETSGMASAANSPAAVVQTGSRKRAACFFCAAGPREAERHESRREARRPHASAQY
ncbi:hypothetical protein [Methylobacterium oxalidis]|nr:hypothetical protein [Methylobacterium oxalidis]GJE31614.1 hypothetical protein LDDCCGHA_1794 [Methylobacterium oxalidis]